MQRSRKGFLVGATAVALVALIACGGGGPSAQDEQRDAEWAWLTEAKQDLDTKRQELVELQEGAVAAAEEVEEAAEEGVEELDEVAVDFETEISNLQGEVTALAESFSERLVAFLNAVPMVEGEEPTERQKQALRMKSDEDIILAKEWIDKGGDYKRAIEIYETALMFDPDNEELQASLAQANADRYMSQERFSQVNNGMLESEVVALLGQVNLHNIRQYPDKEVVAWFYPTSDEGTAAAVWFQPDKSGEMRVYQAKFDAVTREGGEEEG